MEQLEIYEFELMDDILDKIIEGGKESLSDWEKEYLSSFNDMDKRTKMEDEYNKVDSENIITIEELDSFSDYDPREDGEFYKNIGYIMGIGDSMFNYIQNMTDDEYNETQLEILWNGISDDDINEFFIEFDVMGDYMLTDWFDLPVVLKDSFKTYLIQKGYIG